jgi:hypothetical protein
MNAIRNRPPNTVPVFVRQCEEMQGDFIGHFGLEKMAELQRIIERSHFYTVQEGMTHEEVEWTTPQWVHDTGGDPPFFYELVYGPLTK